MKLRQKEVVNRLSNDVNLLTLTAKRVKETEGLYKGYNKTEFYLHGQLYGTIPAAHTQPRKNIKTYTLNSFRWAIKWIN